MTKFVVTVLPRKYRSGFLQQRNASGIARRNIRTVNRRAIGGGISGGVDNVLIPKGMPCRTPWIPSLSLRRCGRQSGCGVKMLPGADRHSRARRSPPDTFQRVAVMSAFPAAIFWRASQTPGKVTIIHLYSRRRPGVHRRCDSRLTIGQSKDKRPDEVCGSHDGKNCRVRRPPTLSRSDNASIPKHRLAIEFERTIAHRHVEMTKRIPFAASIRVSGRSKT